MNFNKQLKSGLRKCTLHKFGADYKQVKDNWYQCEKCHAYHRIENEIFEETDIKERVKIKGLKYKWLSYEFY